MKKSDIEFEASLFKYGIYDKSQNKIVSNSERSFKNNWKRLTNEEMFLYKTGISIDTSNWIYNELLKERYEVREYLIIVEDEILSHFHQFCIERDKTLYEYGYDIGNQGSIDIYNNVSGIKMEIEWMKNYYGDYSMKVYEILKYPEYGIGLEEYLEYIKKQNIMVYRYDNVE